MEGVGFALPSLIVTFILVLFVKQDDLSDGGIDSTNPNQMLFMVMIINCQQLFFEEGGYESPIYRVSFACTSSIGR